MQNFIEKLSNYSMTTKRQDTQENLAHTTLYNITTGGRDFECSSKTTFKDVAPVNNSKLTEAQQNHLISPQKWQNQPDPLLTAPWT